MTKKIITLYDVRRAKQDAEKPALVKLRWRGVRVLDAQGKVVAICQDRTDAQRFIRDSLNTDGWVIK